jgi:hypothetical protein
MQVKISYLNAIANVLAPEAPNHIYNPTTNNTCIFNIRTTTCGMVGGIGKKGKKIIEKPTKMPINPEKKVQKNQ